jgi:hypothetical protein
LDLHVLGVPLVGEEEGSYGGFLRSLFYQAVVANDERLPLFFL